MDELQFLNSIFNISNISSTNWSSTTTTNTDSTNETEAVNFSDVLSAEMSAQNASSSTGSATVEGTETVTKMMPDGSMLVMVMQGDNVVSETKVSTNLGNLDTLLLMNAQQPADFMAASANAALYPNIEKVRGIA